MTFEEAMDNIAKGFEAVGVAVIVIGGVFALLHGVKEFRHLNQFFSDVRREFGRPLILGLEILVAADIIQTVIVDPSFESVAVLALLVAIRIALSFSLDVEVDGMAPWRRAEVEMAMETASDPGESGHREPG